VSEAPKKPGSRVRSATDEDLDRLYGSGRLVLGPVVRPNPEERPTQEDVLEPEDED
jgi:hypothetical protein